MTQQIIGYSCAILTALVWAVAVVFFKLSGERVAPLALNLFKNTVALVLFAATLLVVGEGLSPSTPAQFTWGEIAILLLSGFIGIALADTVFFHSLNLIGVGVAAIVDSLYSPMVVAFAFLMLGESLGPFQYVGAGLILSGVLLAAQLRPPANRTRGQLILGIFLGALSMAMMGFGIVLAKPVLNHFPLIWATTLRLVGGTASLGLFVLLSPRRAELLAVFRPSATWKYSVPGSVLGAYISMTLWVAGFKYIEASIAGILNQTSTLFALVLATLVLKEEFHARKVLAVTLAMIGVVMVALDERLRGWVGG